MKAVLFADMFDCIQNSNSLTLPQSCFSEAELTFDFYSGEVKKLLIKLDPYGGAEPCGNFSIFINTADYLAPKISVVFYRLVRVGGFNICWRVGNITPVLRSSLVVPIVSLTIVLLLSPPVVSKVFEHLLVKHLSNFAEKSNFSILQFNFCKGLSACDDFLTIIYQFYSECSGLWL